MWIAAVAEATRRGSAGRRSAPSPGPVTSTWASVSPKFWRTSEASERSRCAAWALSRSAAVRTGESITVLVTLRRDEKTSRRSVMSTLENATLIASPVLNPTVVLLSHPYSETCQNTTVLWDCSGEVLAATSPPTGFAGSIHSGEQLGPTAEMGL
jgi:hypothetical protein